MCDASILTTLTKLHMRFMVILAALRLLQLAFFASAAAIAIDSCGGSTAATGRFCNCSGSCKFDHSEINSPMLQVKQHSIVWYTTIYVAEFADAWNSPN